MLTPPKAFPIDGENLIHDVVAVKTVAAGEAEQIDATERPSLVLGNYVVSDKLGQGGMGTVFKATHRLMKREVALKVLSPNVTKDEILARRFLRELEAAAKLAHPNIVAAFDADCSGNMLYLIMELVEGQDLAALVKEQGPTTVSQAIDFILQAARGLEHAHRHGVVHRDIKPANLLLDRNGTVKIVDMGLARIDDNASDAVTQVGLTGTGTIIGTVDYMAPEQAEDARHAGPQADIYSLGATMHFLLTAKPVICGDTLGKKLKMLLTGLGLPTSLREGRADVPEALDAVFRKMIARDLNVRYHTVADVIADLEAIRAEAMSAPQAAAADTAVDMPSVALGRNAESTMKRSLPTQDTAPERPDGSLSPQRRVCRFLVDPFRSCVAGRSTLIQRGQSVAGCLAEGMGSEASAIHGLSEDPSPLRFVRSGQGEGHVGIPRSDSTCGHQSGDLGAVVAELTVPLCQTHPTANIQWRDLQEEFGLGHDRTPFSSLHEPCEFDNSLIGAPDRIQVDLRDKRSHGFDRQTRFGNCRRSGRNRSGFDSLS